MKSKTAWHDISLLNLQSIVVWQLTGYSSEVYCSAAFVLADIMGGKGACFCELSATYESGNCYWFPYLK